MKLLFKTIKHHRGLPGCYSLLSPFSITHSHRHICSSQTLTMHFIAASAIIAASVATASALTVRYGSTGIVAVNYGVCNNVGTASTGILTAESSAGDFVCRNTSPTTVWCYGRASLPEACPAIRDRCSSYGGIYDSGACTQYI
ncbi:hypothetical protein GQ42DRAFT_171799 [Ramicandelaber brevisporus]|nr:hypothetical protein GQ42DRAFT_171799 [Ramicandelaber brevisporus]